MISRTKSLNLLAKAIPYLLVFSGIVFIVSYTSPASAQNLRQDREEDNVTSTPTPESITPVFQESDSSPQTVAFAIAAQTAEPICGQVVEVTSCDRRSSNFIFFPCNYGISNPQTPSQLLTLGGVNKDGYYRVNDYILESIGPVGPLCTNRGDVTERMRTLSPLEPISSCAECGAAPPKIPLITTGADFIVADFRWNPPPEAFKNFSLIVNIQNSLDVQPYVPNNGHYKIEVEFGLQLGDPIIFFFDSENPESAKRLSPVKLPPLASGSETTITLSDLTFPSSVTKGSVQVRFIPKDGDSNQRNNGLIKELTITGLPTYGIFQCVGMLSSILGGNVLTTEPYEIQTKLQLDMWKDLAVCSQNNDNQCASDQFSRMTETAPDLLATLISAIGSPIKNGIGCSLEVLNFLTSRGAPKLQLPDAVVNTKGLNVRDGPGTVYQDIGDLYQDDELDVIGRNNSVCSWLQVITPTGAQGWVSGSSQYVTLNVPCTSIRVVSVSLPGDQPPVANNPAPTAQPPSATSPSQSSSSEKIVDVKLSPVDSKRVQLNISATGLKTNNQCYGVWVSTSAFRSGMVTFCGVNSSDYVFSGMWVELDNINPSLCQKGSFTTNDLTVVLKDGDTEQDITSATFPIPYTWCPSTSAPAPTPVPPSTPAESPLTFTAERTTLTAGECTNLRWDVDNVRAVYFDNLAATGHETRKVCPAATQTFHLVIVYPGNRKVEQTVTIQVTGSSSAPATPSISFSADRTILNPGECAILRWDVDNVNEIHLGEEGVVGHDTRKVCPESTETYKLAVIRRDGNEEKRTVTIQVNEPVANEPSEPAQPQEENYIYGKLMKANAGLDQWFFPCHAFHPVILNYSLPTTPPGLVDGAYYRVRDPQFVQTVEQCHPDFGCTHEALLITVDDNPYDNWEVVSSCN